jgi:hypothetical protein
VLDSCGPVGRRLTGRPPILWRCHHRPARRRRGVLLTVGDLLDAMIDALEHEPAVLRLISDAVATAGGDLDLGLDLVMRRLSERRPEDMPVANLLVQRALQLAAADAWSGRARRELLLASHEPACLATLRAWPRRGALCPRRRR